MAKASAKANAAELSPEKQAVIDNMTASGDWEAVVGSKNIQLAAGQEIEGTLVSAPEKAGKSFAFSMQHEGEEGSVTYWSPTVLTNLLRDIRIGSHIKVRCLGKVLVTQNGTAWDFVVAVRK